MSSRNVKDLPAYDHLNDVLLGAPDAASNAASPEPELAYYRELAHKRGELVSCLMSGNHGYGAFLIQDIKKLEEAKTFPAGRAPTVTQKQDLVDALAKITNAVNKVVG